MSGDGPSKMSGNVNYATGQVKETVGNLVGANDMARGGAEQKAKGDAEYKAAEAKQYGEGAKDDLVGGVKKNVSKLTGDDSGEAKNAMRQEKGKVQKSANS